MVALQDRLRNPDLAPVPEEARTWTRTDYLMLWIGMATNIPTWLMAGSLIALGMAWWQAMLIISVGNLIVLVPIMLNSHAGAKYGIPFPVFARASFGLLGANGPAILRGLIASVWFGIQVFVGAQALKALSLRVTPLAESLAEPRLGGQGLLDWLCYVVFLILNLVVLRRGMGALRRFERWAAPAVLLLAAALCAWAIGAAGGWGPILSRTAQAEGSFGDLVLRPLMGVIGFWATLSLNASDFTRFARSQRDQAIGQAIGLPGTMVLFSLLGVLTTSATAIVFGQVVWDPVQLSNLVPSPALSMLCLIAILLATLSVNIPANLVSAAVDATNLWPRRIDLWRGALIAAAVGTLVMPWRLMADAATYIDKWLVPCSAALAPVAGILIADYWLVRRRILVVEDLYRTGGAYPVWSWRGYMAFAAGLLAAFSGPLLSIPILTDIGWISGITVALAVYYALATKAR